jgi:hypothetical protein
MSMSRGPVSDIDAHWRNLSEAAFERELVVEEVVVLREAKYIDYSDLPGLRNIFRLTGRKGTRWTKRVDAGLRGQVMRMAVVHCVNPRRRRLWDISSSRHTNAVDWHA